MSTGAAPVSGDRTGSDREFWLDAFAARLGVGRIAARLPGDVPPSYLYAVVAIGVPNLLSAAFHQYYGLPLIYRENPYFALQPVLLLAAVFVARRLQADYDRVMAEMNVAERASDPDALLEGAPSWLPWGLFAVAVAIQLLSPRITAGWDVMDYAFNYFVFPFVYTPIVVQFFTVYVTIEFFAPWRLARSDVGIHFLDPQGVGGLRPLGELIKKAYYFVVVGLVGYALVTYAPFVDTGWEVSAGANVTFTSIWVVTIGTVAFAVFTLHRFMHREKRAEIQRLEAELREHIENPWDVANYEIPEDERERVEDLRERIQQVSDTGEYPATFSIWSQLLLSIALPKAVQLLLASV